MSHPTVQRQLREANRARLREAALHEFALHGQHGARVSEIVARAELTQPCFYRVWSSKEEAFFCLMNDLRQIAPQMARAFLDLSPHVPLSEGVLDVTRQHFRYLVEHADITRLVVQHLLADQAWHPTLFTPYEDVFTELQRRGQLDTDLRPTPWNTCISPSPITGSRAGGTRPSATPTRFRSKSPRCSDVCSTLLALRFIPSTGQFPTAPSPRRSRHEPHPTHRP